MRYVKALDLFKKISYNNPKEAVRLLGLDVGNKYVGLAISDVQNKVASPLSVLVRKKTNIDLMARDVQTLVSEFSLGGFVVGYPYESQGGQNIDAVQVKLFVQDLQETGKLDGLCFTYWDERYSSRCVEALLKPLDLHPVHAKSVLDKFAAVGILQGYLDHCNQKLKDFIPPFDRDT